MNNCYIQLNCNDTIKILGVNLLNLNPYQKEITANHGNFKQEALVPLEAYACSDGEQLERICRNSG